MKLLIIVDGLKGGAANIAQLLAINLSNSGHNVYFIYKKRNNNISKYNLEGIITIEQTNYLRKSLVHDIYFFKSKINQIKPDLIISFLSTVSTRVLFSQWFSSIPIIVSERTNPFEFPANFKDKLLRNISYRRANLITVQFKDFEQFDKVLYKKKKVVVIPNLIVASNYLMDYGINKKTISFVTFATLYHVKRIDLMIKLFSVIHKRCPNTELNIFGEGVDKIKLQSLIVELDLNNSVHIKGHVNNVHECLIENDIYLMTSIREGFPNSLSEAMAVGLPSVSFKCHEGLTELIKSGDNGYLITEGKHEEFCEVAIDLVNNKEKRLVMGKNALIHTRKYNEESVMEIWNNCILKLISKKRIKN